VSTDLVKTEGQALSKLGIHSVVLMPNPLVLVQNTTGIEGSIPGTFLDTVSKKAFNKIVAAPLTCSENRVLFETDDLDSPVVCKSFNGVTPVTGDLAAKYNLSPQSKTCATCEFSSWAKYRTEGIKPRCKQKFRMMFIDTEDELPYLLNIGGMSIKPFNDFLTTVARDMVSIANRDGIEYNLYDYIVEISPLKNYGKKGNYYTVKFSPPEKVKDRGKYKDLFNQYVRAIKAPVPDEDDSLINEFVPV
jgi:hypothetical protein